jgi:hypothetical protein
LICIILNVKSLPCFVPSPVGLDYYSYAV